MPIEQMSCALGTEQSISRMETGKWAVERGEDN
jgi:hypothetical protein